MRTTGFGLGACWILFGLLPIASLAAVDDTVVQDVQVQGNKAVSTADINKAIKLKPGAPLSRAAVLADVERIEGLYKHANLSVRVATDLTHPGEKEGKPRTTMTYLIEENAKPRKFTIDDPLEVYYDNTLVCAAAKTGNDLCHLWLNRDGSFINFDAGEAKTGHYTVGPVRADGKVAVCQYWDNPNMISPSEVKPQMPAPPPPVAGASAGVMICRTDGYRTTCLRGVDPETLSEQDRKAANRSMGERFYNGMCYPIGPHEVGDIWFEADDPLPGQQGMDRMLLIPGRQ
jgi:hypothetical protein